MLLSERLFQNFIVKGKVVGALIMILEKALNDLCMKSRFHSLRGGLVINGGETATVSTASL